MFLNDEINFCTTNDEIGFRFVDNSLDAAPVVQRSPRTELGEAYRTILALTQAHPDLKSEFEDWLMTDGFKATKRKTAPMPFGPAAIQVSIWDNWLGDKPRKSKPHRWGVTIKVWTDAEIDFRDTSAVDWNGTATLMDATALRAKGDKMRGPKGQTYPISSAYHQMIMDLCETLPDAGMSAGMMVSKPRGEGTLCHDRQMVLADVAAITAGDTSAKLVILLDENTPLVMPAFSTQDAAGKPLGSRRNAKSGEVDATCVMQARWAADAKRLGSWTTG